MGDVLPFYIVSFFGLYVYFSVSTVVDVRGKKRVLKINLVDYLENHLSPRIEVTRQDMEMLYGEAVFEEKPLPYGRVRGGRKGKGRKGSRGVQAKPEKRRTVELMPIESRMAAGGEQLQREDSAEQIYSVRQQMRQEEVRQMPQAEEEQQNMRISRMDRAQRADQMPETGREQSIIPETGREQRMMPETGREQSIAPETGREQRMTPETGGKQSITPETGREQKMMQVSGNEEQWKARSAEEQPAVQMGENRQQPDWPPAENALWMEQERGTQIQPLFPGGQAAREKPEDTAAVTEEELEALLKEFLTT